MQYITKKELSKQAVQTAHILRKCLLKKYYHCDNEQDFFQSQQNEYGIEQIQQIMVKFVTRPLISIVMPTFNSSPELLEKVLKAVNDQIYEHWELCVVDDGSTDKRCRLIVERYANDNPKIHYRFNDANSGISSATNEAIAMASGEFVALLDHDDLLTSDALFWVAREINQYPDVDYLYTDQISIVNLSGKPCKLLRLKSGWAPEYLYNYMETEHLSVFRKSIVVQSGGCRSRFDFSQDYDLALRVSEITPRIRHIPRILYVWQKQYHKTARPVNMLALQEHLDRCGIDADIAESVDRHEILFRCNNDTKCSIIIPSDSPNNAIRCISSVLRKTVYRNFEIIVVCNSGMAKMLRDRFVYSNKIKTYCYDEKYNFSKKCNMGATVADGEILVFMNDDVYPDASEWLINLFPYLFNNDVGAVSPLLFHSDKTIQYAGMYTGHALITATCSYGKHYLEEGLHHSVHPVSIVSGACFAVRKNTFEEIGGFDSVHTPIAHSDIDLSFRLLRKGYRILYTPNTSLFHEGNASWHMKDGIDKADIFILKQYGDYIHEDPCYSRAVQKFYESQDIANVSWHIPQMETRKEYTFLDVLFFTHELSLTGAPRAVYYATLAVKMRGGFPVVLSPSDGPLRMEFEKAGIAVCIDTRIRKGALTAQLATFINNFDIAICSTITLFKYVQQISQESTVPVLFWLHETSVLKELVEKNPEIKNIVAMRNVHTVICSRYAQQYAKEWFVREPGILYLGFDLPQRSFPSSRIEKLRTAIIGTIEERKGHDIFVDALTMLPPDIRRQSEYLLVGAPAPSFEMRCEAWIQAEDIHATGLLPHAETIDVMMTCDIIVCASRTDPFPFVVLEAMALGKAIILSDHVGCTEVLQNEISCLQFPSENGGMLSEALQRLITDADLRMRIGKNAKSVYESNFTEQAFRKRFIPLLENIAASRFENEHK